MDDAISPATLAGVALWLESSTESIEVDSARVFAWKDSSPLKQVATAPLDARPSLEPKAVNDMPAVVFDGAPSILEVVDSDAFHFGTKPFTVAFVGEWHNSENPIYTIENGIVRVSYPGYALIMKKVTVGSPYDGLAITANAPSPFSTTPAMRRLGAQLRISEAAITSKAKNLNDGSFRLYVVQRSEPGLLAQRINGAAQNSADVPEDLNATATNQPLRIGGEGAQPFLGSLAEVVIIKGAITPNELSGLEHYLMNKFDL